MYYIQYQHINFKNLFIMKTMRVILIAMAAIFMNMNIHAQDKKQKTESSVKTVNLKVEGNCGQCKARIEKAAKIEGVNKAEWNQETKILTLAFNPAKVSSDDVLKKVATAGHDNEKFKADDNAYGSLPGCCKYRESAKK
jgi:mercuric ion binding protein